ncbi:asparagine-linked glycosylase, putative [Acanthamoeba castellanii str. Neff]|uniref:Dol-P-Glc:Glc(2)Man(9)GlcNAc(2)-PP-Dol alpha-1,2-glucosyltransferase n=1 Tax=Acanthamoeba castellanii (strain ATCC 30010 / Neff) TaxID=1257118 RepID=L8HJ96_ACACF|nr:asparagine-linked glycosylase, putative [Acanthamoeba castellanii str. Neff]ELR24476.1 asparagine-linked glycosylase, putative [Acanthamoeba castellanii str. Neff]
MGAWWVGTLLLGGYAALAGITDHYVGSQPYMTERYCRGEFWVWDPMITTFPGLYFIFALLFKVADAVRQAAGLHHNYGAWSLCSVEAMRGMNTLFGVLNFFLFYQLVAMLYHHNQTSSSLRAGRGYRSAQRVLMALLPHLFPVQFFFYFLYYTDTVSTFFVFLCYYLSLCDRTTLSGLVGFLAVACRQTNIVWVCFIAFSMVLRQYYKSRGGSDGAASTLGLLRFAVQNSRSICARLWTFLVLAASFLVFVYLNEGIVIGDRTQHSPRLHFVQLFYFLAFTAAWVWPRLLLGVVGGVRRRGWSVIVKHNAVHFVIGAVATLPIILYLIHNYTYAHPYLLADNRHYPFYVWKNFFRRNENFKYAYSLVYYAAGFALWKLLGTKVSPLWRLAYFACTAVVLVPASLLEFRYFIIPFLFLLLHTMPSAPGLIDASVCCASSSSSSARHTATCTKDGSGGRAGQGRGEKDRRKKPRSDGAGALLDKANLACLAVECLTFVAVNAATLYIFALRPFAWPSGEVARIMW